MIICSATPHFIHFNKYQKDSMKIWLDNEYHKYKSGSWNTVTYKPVTSRANQPADQKHYAKLSRAMRAPWVDRFLNNETYSLSFV